MAGTAAHLVLLLSSLLAIQGPDHCTSSSSTSSHTCTIASKEKRAFYCGYRLKNKTRENESRLDRCPQVNSTEPIIINCKENTGQTKEQESGQYPLPPKANSRVNRDVLVTLLVLSLVLNSSLATYIFFLRRHYKQSTSLGQAMPPVTLHGSDHLYEEIADFHTYKCPPPLPPALRATQSFESINSLYQKFSDKKEETEDAGPSSGSTSKQREDQYVELSHGYAGPADAQPLGEKKDLTPRGRSSGVETIELSNTESDSRFSNEAETCSVRTHGHRLSDAHECDDAVINLEA